MTLAAHARCFSFRKCFHRLLSPCVCLGGPTPRRRILYTLAHPKSISPGDGAQASGCVSANGGLASPARSPSPAGVSPALLGNVPGQVTYMSVPSPVFPFSPPKATGEHELAMCARTLSYPIGPYAVCLSYLRINLKDEPVVQHKPSNPLSTRLLSHCFLSLRPQRLTGYPVYLCSHIQTLACGVTQILCCPPCACWTVSALATWLAST